MSAAVELDAFPLEVFDTPVLRDLDENSVRAIVDASRVRSVHAGALLYSDGEPSDSFFVVIAGSVEIFAMRRGDEETTRLRTADAGDTFGEEATLPGLTRRGTARAFEATRLAEIPVAVFRRATGRKGESRTAEREKRYLHRALIRDLVASSALGRGLGSDDLDVLLDAAELRRVRRGAHIYEIGDAPEACYLLAEGLVQLQCEKGAQPSIRAYIARGDFFGEEEILAACARKTGALASGDTWCVRLPAETLQQVAERNPGLLAEMRRVASAERERQARVLGTDTSKPERFQDLYRLQVAGSLLVIDQDACVRCGHCAWSCSEVHGASRLVRRGDTIQVGLPRQGTRIAPTTLSLPNACQHCRNAACMVDCPTSAIGRDARGEVFIREELCTGCNSCAKACPWDNIAMAPREGAPTLSATVAVKCDLCRDFEAPACVQACPTEAIFRIEPARDITELQQLGGTAAAQTNAPASQALSTGLVAIASAIALTLPAGGFAFALERAGHWQAGRGVGLLAAVLAGLCIALLAAYALPKRGVRWWMKRRVKMAARAKKPVVSAVVRSRMKPQLIAHVVIGLAACTFVLAHAGLRVPSSAGGALNLAFWLAVLTGVLGGALYVMVPCRLTRLEGHSALPEDLRGQRGVLLDRLYRESSGREELVKAIVTRVLIPYARVPLGSLAFAMSGRSLLEERRRLRGRIDTMLESRGEGRLEGLDALIKIVVDLRALPSRRALSAVLRAWLPVHIVAVAMTLALLATHVVMVVLL